MGGGGAGDEALEGTRVCAQGMWLWRVHLPSFQVTTHPKLMFTPEAHLHHLHNLEKQICSALDYPGRLLHMQKQHQSQQRSHPEGPSLRYQQPLSLY